MLATTGRLLAAHWPALLAWYLAGTIGRYAAIQAAGWVGAESDLGGALLLPLAPLARLVSYVAMVLVVRDGLAHLGVLAPRPEDPAERRRDFGRALLGGIVPFVALYTAYSYLSQDAREFALRALDRRTEIQLSGLDFTNPGLSQPVREWDYVPGELVISPVSITIVVVAFAARWAIGRGRLDQLRWLAPVRVYLEALWVVLSAMLVLDLIDLVNGWVQSRVAMVWLGDAREWLLEFLFPVVWLWDGLMWLIGEAGGVILLPLAWLAVVGSIYGQAVAAKAPALSGAGLERVRRRWTGLRAPAQKVIRDASSLVTGRFTPIWRAIVLMWRAGPLLIGGYVLLFVVVGALEPLFGFALTRIVGPQDFEEFWVAIGNALLVIPDVLTQVLLVPVVAAAYDATLRRLAPLPEERAAAPAPTAEPASGLVPPVPGDAARPGISRP